MIEIFFRNKTFMFENVSKKTCRLGFIFILFFYFFCRPVQIQTVDSFVWSCGMGNAWLAADRRGVET